MPCDEPKPPEVARDADDSFAEQIIACDKFAEAMRIEEAIRREESESLAHAAEIIRDLCAVVGQAYSWLEEYDRRKRLR